MPPSMTPHVDLYNIVRETRTAIAYAKSHALDSLLDDLETLAREWAFAAAPDEDKAPSPEPVDADEYRAMVRPAPVAEPEPEPDEFAVVRAAPAVEPAPPAEPSKRPRRRTPPPPVAPPGPVEDAPVDGDDGDGFGAIPF